MARTANLERVTNETQLKLELDLDGDGSFAGSVGVPFLEHMLDLLARHGGLSLTVSGEGDTEIDAHHTTEDVGIVLGQAITEALGDKKGITRYGHAYVPMDESLARAVIDLSGRPAFVWNVDFAATQRVGDFDVELAQEFWNAVAMNACCNLHVELLYGQNAHHKIEAIFKACARALRAACAPDPRSKGVPSTKGAL